MKKSTKKSLIALVLVILLAVAVSCVVTGPAKASDCPPDETCQVVATPQPQHEDYGNPSYPEICVGEQQEINILQIRDEYHVDTIANQDLKIRDLETDLMMTTSSLFDSQWRVKKQAAKIRHLRALLGRR
jgi:hypothetical protein